MPYKLGAEKNKETILSVLLKEKRTNPAEMCRKADLEYSQVYPIVNGKQHDMLLSTAKRIANAMNCSLDTCFGDGDMGFRTRLLQRIESEEAKLHDMDANGHIWWNNFKQIVKELQ